MQWSHRHYVQNEALCEIATYLHHLKNPSSRFFYRAVRQNGSELVLNNSAKQKLQEMAQTIASLPKNKQSKANSRP